MITKDEFEKYNKDNRNGYWLTSKGGLCFGCKKAINSHEHYSISRNTEKFDNLTLDFHIECFLEVAGEHWMMEWQLE